MPNVAFYYEIAREAKMAHDTETGEPAEAYVKVSMDVVNLPDDEMYKEMIPGIKSYLANQIKIPVELLRAISKEEYEIEHGED